MRERLRKRNKHSLLLSKSQITENIEMLQEKSFCHNKNRNMQKHHSLSVQMTAQGYADLLFYTMGGGGYALFILLTVNGTADNP